MKILIVSHAWPPSIGGAESFARDLAEWLVGRGADVHVLTTDASDSSAFDVGAPHFPFRTGRDRRAGAEIRRLPLAGGALQRLLHRMSANLDGADGRSPSRVPILSALRWSPLISRIVWRALETRPDVIVALPMPFVTVFAACLAARIGRRPFVCIPCLHPGEPAPFGRPWVRAVLSRSDAVLALTPAEGNLALSLGARLSRVAVTGMGLDPESLDPGFKVPPDEWRIPSSAPVVLFLGRIEERKGIEVLVEAMETVVRSHPEAWLVLAGPPGKGEERILSVATSRPNVLHLGKVDGTERAFLLERARLLVLPAEHESFGRVLLEAWACSKPVVVPAGSPQANVVESGRTGLTFAPRTPGALAAAIAGLVEDAEHASRLGAAGRAKLSADYTWDAAGGRILTILRDLARRGEGGSTRLDRGPLRVLFVEHVNRLGGAEIALVRLVRALPRGRVTPLALCPPGPGGLAESLAEAACRVLRLDLDGIKPSRPLTAFVTMRHLATLVRRERIDAVYMNGLRSLKAALAFGSPSAPPLFCHIHDVLGPENVTRSLRWARFFSDRVHTFLAASQAAADSLVAHGIPRERVRVVHEAVDADSLGPLRSSAEVRRDLSIPPDARVVGFVGQFDPRKGLEDFLLATERLLDNDPGVWAIVVGDDVFEKHGRFREAILARIRERTDGRIVATGLRADVPDLIGAMDVVVCPSRQDACPLTILEAMAGGKPVVATRVGGIPEEVEEGVTGILVEAGDTTGLAEGIRRVLESPGRAAAMGAAGEKRVREKFSLTRQAAEIESILVEALLPRERAGELNRCP